jgi:CBS domain-containing protein
MKVNECMCNLVYCVKPNTNIYEVAKIMSENHIGCVPVCNESNDIVGLVTDRDLVLRALACDKNAKSTPVSEIMTCNDICCCSPDDDISFAENLMSQNQIRRLPIVKNNKVVGILTMGNLAQYDRQIGKENVCNTIENICNCDGQTQNCK